MPADTKLITQFYVKVAGLDLQVTKMPDLHEIEVDVSFHMPSTALLKFYDSNNRWTNGTLFELGSEIEITAADRNGARAGLFKGVVMNLEPEFIWEGAYAMFVVRAYDKSHQLHRGATSGTYRQVKDSDVIAKVAGEAGLSSDVQATSVVHEHIFRRAQSGYEFISTLARRNGYVVFYDTETAKLVAKAPTKFTGNTLKLTYGQELLEFRPRIALGGQVDKVQVAGWDPAQKREVIGTASSPRSHPTETAFNRGPTLAKSSLSSSAKLHLADTVSKAAQADAVAQAVFDRMAASDLTAEALALGNANLKPGTTVSVSNLGRFSGSYLVTRVRHMFNMKDAYHTEFWVGGMNSLTVSGLLTDDPRSIQRAASAPVGLQVALVTNSKDPDNKGRVKLKFPTVSNEMESTWARVAAPGAGADRGLMLLPEVNDEVLVGFLNGDFDQPLVLGGLWNSKDSIPNTTPTGGQGEVNVREFKSRSGHILRFTDTKNEEKIEVLGHTGSESITIDSKNNTIKLFATKDITIESTSGKVILKGQSIEVTGVTKVDVGAPTVTAEGKAQIVLKGAMAELTATGIAKISGTMVNIN